MKIYLVRHGEAVSPEINPDCPLSPEGTKELEKLGTFFAAHGFPLSEILHSQKLRAKQTAEILGRYLEPKLQIEEYKHLNPSDPIEPILDRLDDGVMVVGHLPYLQKLSGYLIAHDQDATVIKFSLGMVACLEKLNGRYALDWAIGTNLVS